MHPIDSKMKRVNFYREIALSNGNYANYVRGLYTSTKYLAKDVHNSSKIEGNTVTINDTERLLNGVYAPHEAISKYSIGEVMELQGLYRAINYMYTCSSTQHLTEGFIKGLHGYLTENIPNLNHEAGNYRRDGAGSTDGKGGVERVYEHPNRIKRCMIELIQNWNNSNKTLEDIASLVTDFVVIHPFTDGNGRVSRLLLNWALISNGYVPIIIEYKEREEYINTLKMHDLWGDMLEFLDFLCNKLIQVYKNVI